MSSETRITAEEVEAARVAAYSAKDWATGTAAWVAWRALEKKFETQSEVERLAEHDVDTLKRWLQAAGRRVGGLFGQELRSYEAHIDNLRAALAWRTA